MNFTFNVVVFSPVVRRTIVITVIISQFDKSQRKISGRCFPQWTQFRYSNSILTVNYSINSWDESSPNENVNGWTEKSDEKGDDQYFPYLYFASEHLFRYLDQNSKTLFPNIEWYLSHEQIHFGII